MHTIRSHDNKYSSPLPLLSITTVCFILNDVHQAGYLMFIENKWAEEMLRTSKQALQVVLRSEGLRMSIPDPKRGGKSTHFLGYKVFFSFLRCRGQAGFCIAWARKWCETVSNCATKDLIRNEGAKTPCMIHLKIYKNKLSSGKDRLQVGFG